MLRYFTMINTFHSDHERKLSYEGGNFIQKLCFILKIFTSEGSHSKSWFKSGGPESRGGMVSISRSIQWWYYGQESRNRDRKGSGVVEKTEKYCAHVPNEERRAASKIAVSDSRGGMFSAFAGVYGSWIAPENRNGTRKGSGVVEITEDQGGDCTRPRTVCWDHSNSQFSQLLPTPFESRFDFLDRFNTHKHWQRLETFRGANQSLRFWTRPSSCCCSQFCRNFSIISETTDIFRALFRDSGPF